MKRRLMFVSNSSSSSWIITIPQKEERINRNILKELVIEHYNTKSEKKLKRFIEDVSNACHSLIDPTHSQKYKYYRGIDQLDLDTFLLTIGFKTLQYSGNKSKRLFYKKLYDKIFNNDKKGFYLIAGQDADEMNCFTASTIEEILLKYVSNNKQTVDLGYCELTLIEFRP